MRRFALPALLLFLTLALLQNLCFAEVNSTFLRETFNETFEGRSVVFEKEDYRVNKRARGRPSKGLSVGKEEIKPNKNAQRHKVYREKKKCELNSLRKRQELVMEFLEEKGLTEEWNAFFEKHDEENLEMIQTVELEDVTAVNSSSSGAMGTEKREKEHDGAHQGKRPATAYTTPRRHPIGGLMADARRARQNYGHTRATQGPLLSTNKGTQIQMREAAHDGEASTSSWAPAPHHELGVKMIKAAVTLGGNLMKGLLQSMLLGSEFLNLPLLDTIQLYASLQNEFNEGLTLIGQGHPIDDNIANQSDNPPVVVSRSFFRHYNLLGTVP